MFPDKYRFLKFQMWQRPSKFSNDRSAAGLLLEASVFPPKVTPSCDEASKFRWSHDLPPDFWATWRKTTIHIDHEDYVDLARQMDSFFSLWRVAVKQLVRDNWQLLTKRHIRSDTQIEEQCIPVKQFTQGDAPRYFRHMLRYLPVCLKIKILLLHSHFNVNWSCWF